MRKRLSTLGLALAMAGAMALTACHNDKQTKLTDMSDTVSWVLGRNTAESLKSGAIKDIDNEVFLAAVRTTVENGEQPISDSTYAAIMQDLLFMARGKGRAAQDEKRLNVQEAQAEYFQKLTATNSNIKKHKDGYYYEVVKKGEGKNAEYASHVWFDYKSYLMFTGEPYDQTYGKRPPINTVVGKPMFPGLISGLQLMNRGSIYRFYFPYELAFGQTGSGDIPPYTPLIYEVELHNISDK